MASTLINILRCTRSLKRADTKRVQEALEDAGDREDRETHSKAIGKERK
jgi:hypothetical protein